jgi:hypothetical protein
MSQKKTFSQCLRSSKFHLTFTFFWITLIAPTMIWWKESILWVALMSLYANIVGHFSAYQAARAEEAIEKSKNEQR